MDDLDKYILEREEREPGFAQLVSDAEKRQAFARELAGKRRSSGQSQTQVAARMQTSASIVSRLEAGADVRVSTLEKYVSAIGMQLNFRVVAEPRLRSKRGEGRSAVVQRVLGRSAAAATATKGPNRVAGKSSAKRGSAARTAAAKRTKRSEKLAGK